MIKQDPWILGPSKNSKKVKLPWPPGSPTWVPSPSPCSCGAGWPSSGPGWNFLEFFFHIWFSRSLALHDINIEAQTQLLAEYISWPHTSSIHLENLKRSIFKAIKIMHFETFQSKTLLLPPIVPIQKTLNLFRFLQQLVWFRFQSLWLLGNFKYFLRDSAKKSRFGQEVYH